MSAEARYPHQTGLMIAIPLTGRSLPPYFTWSFANLHPPMNYAVRYLTNFDNEHRVIPAPIADLRNWFVSQAIAQQCKYLFMLDEDVTVPGHTIRQLIFQMEHHADAAVITGIYCHKAEPHMPMVFRGNGAGPYWDWKAGEFFEISGCGMGATMLRVSAFKDIEPPYFKTVDDCDAFLDGRNAAESWTEDLYAMKKLEEAGWKAYADASILCDHWDMTTNISARLPFGSKPLERPSMNGKRRVVDLGCGEFPYQPLEDETVITVDAREEVHADYRADLRRLPFASAEFDVVTSNHTLEHFGRNEIDAVLDEWLRIMKPDGEFRIRVPNLEWAAAEIARGNVDHNVLNVLYGEQTYDLNFHKVAFTPAILRGLLEARGLEVEIALDGYTIEALGRRKVEKAKDEQKEIDAVIVNRKDGEPKSVFEELPATLTEAMAQSTLQPVGKVRAGLRLAKREKKRAKSVKKAINILAPKPFVGDGKKAFKRPRR